MVQYKLISGLTLNNVFFSHSALSQDDQDDAQLKIEDILQMVSHYVYFFFMHSLVVINSIYSRKVTKA